MFISPPLSLSDSVFFSISLFLTQICVQQQLNLVFDCLAQAWRRVEVAEEELSGTRAEYQRRMAELRDRAEAVEKGKREVAANWKKFQLFIREKQGKVEEGERRVEWEQRQQRQQGSRLKRLERELQVHSEARHMLKEATASR